MPQGIRLMMGTKSGTKQPDFRKVYVLAQYCVIDLMCKKTSL